MKNKKLLFILAAVAILAAVLIIVTQFQKPKESSENVIKIGAILPLTGDLALMGKQELNAIKLALQKESIKSLKVVFYDSQGDNKTAISIAQKAITADNIRYFLSSLSGVSMSLKEFVESNKNAFLGVVAFHPKLTENSDFTIRFIYDGKEEAAVISDYLIKKGGSIFIIASQTPLEEYEIKEVILPKLRAYGVDYKIEWFDFGTKDFRSQIAKLKSVSPDYLVILGYGSDITLLMKQLVEQNALHKVSVVGGIGFLELRGKVDINLVKNVAFAVPSFLLEENGDKYNQLSKEFKQLYGEDIPYDAAFIYDAVIIINEALKKSEDKSPLGLRKFILNNEFQGITGKIRFDEKGNLLTELTLVNYDANFNLKKVLQ